MRSATEYTVSDLVAEFLTRVGVSTAFGIASVHNIPLLDAVARRGAIRFVMTRGELGAGHMADAHARASGELGLVITSTGPAAANVATGLLEALGAATPLLHITGQSATRHAERRRGSTHDVPAQLAMLKSVGKAAYCIRTPDEALGVLIRAATEALNPPCGPVSVEIPIDIQRAALPRPGSLDDLRLHLPPLEPPGSTALDALTERVLRARRPMLWVGSGARFARAPVEALLAMGFGLVTSWSGRGVVSEDHPQNLGALHGLGAPKVEAFYESVDLMLVAGSRLRGQETMDFAVKLPRSRVQIDIDPMAEGRSYATESFVRADAALTLAALVQRLQAAGYRAEAAYPAEFAAVKTAARAAFRETLGPYASFPEQLRAVMPRNALFVRDITVANSTWGHRLFPVHGPRDSVFSVSAGIGQGLPMAVGAAVAAARTGGGKKTVLLSGDGGFALNLGELWTAAQERLDLVMIVMNDGGYSVIKHMQDAQCAGNRQYGDLLAPDFKTLAASAGMSFWKVQRAADFGAAVAAALEVAGPTLVEVDMNTIGAHPPYFPYSALAKGTPKA